MKVICLVPSLTESLLLAGCDLVGRTKFCIHPKEKVTDIAIVGGTKFVDWSKAPTADLVIFDKEENRKKMAEDCPYPYIAVHIRSVEDLQQALVELGTRLENTSLLKMAEEALEVIKRPIPRKQDLRDLPGRISFSPNPIRSDRFLYLIWYKPWMAVGRDTFIHSVFCHLGYKDFFQMQEAAYPQVDLENKEYENTLLLLSTEPYPFAQNKKLLSSLKQEHFLVNGESYSWFGHRAIEFLKQHKK